MKPKEYRAQLGAMLAKNGKLHVRHIGGTICEVLLPLILVGLGSLTVYLYLSLIEPLNSLGGYVSHFPAVKVHDVTFYHSYSNVCWSKNKTCLLGITPDTNETRNFGKQFFEEVFALPHQGSNLPRLEYFASEDTFRSTVDRDPANFYAGIVFKDTQNLQSYSLYMNSTLLPADNKATSRFSALQKEIDRVLIELATPKTPNSTSYNIQTYAKLLPGYSASLINLGSIIGYVVACLSVCGSIPLFSTLLCHLVSENKAKVREFLFILGLKKSVYWLSWTITALVPGLIYVIICLVLNYVVKTFVGDVFLMTVSYVLYVMSLILFGFLLQSVISNIIIAIVVSIFWIYIPAQALSVLPVNRALYGTLCLVSPFDFMFLTFKKATESLSTNSIIPVATNDLGYPWLVSILFVDCVIYGLAAWYVNEIKTGDYGVSKPWNFPFKKSYWFPSTAPQESQRLIDEGAADEQNQDMFEDNSETQMGVVVANLKKIYTQHNATPVLAVRGINAGFGRDKITALLGHNGAGKSTTINMLVGLITPTSGDAVIEGKSILTHMDEIRNHIGICPQEDFLFPDLTAPEHLRLVARLRGYTSPTLKEDINAALANIGLPESDHKNMRTKKFSGGMKRKLSLAIALFGNPSVVVLDEPTTGIDAASKRAIWDTFTREKEGKTIILTTHSMEEADALSDHIYIMSDGQLKCGGSSMFLKNKFGTGYYVNFEKRQNFSSEAVLGIVKKHIPDAAVYNETAEVAVLTVPFGHTQLFPTVFRELDAKKDQLGIKSYGLSLTTLEDVFVRMGTDRETTGLNHEAHIPRVTSEDNNRANEKDGEDDEEDSNNEKKIIFDDSCPPPSSVGRQFATVLFVNWLFYVRRKIRTAVILGLPVLLIALFVLPSKFIKSPIPVAKDKDIYNSLAKTTTTIPYAITNNSGMNKTAFSEMLGGISALYPKVAFKECDSVEEIDNYTSRVGGFIAGLGISKFDPNNKKITYTFLYNESVPGSAVQIQNLMDTALLRYTDNTSGGRIDVWSHAIGPGLNTIMADETTMGTNFIVFVLLGLLISSALGVQRLVYEKECMFKPQLFIAGMRPLVYCTGNILSLSLPILVSSVLIAALSAAIGINGTTGEMFVPLLLTLVVFSFSLSSFNYLFSKIFKKSEDCVKWIVVFQAILSILPIIIQLILMLLSPTVKPLKKLVEVLLETNDYLTPILPVCSFVGALKILVLKDNSNLSDLYKLYHGDNKWFGFYSVYLLADFFVFLIVSVVVDYFAENYLFRSPANVKKTGNREQLIEDDDENEDVAELRLWAENEAESRHNSVTTRHLSKNYRNLTAVKNLSITIKPNECFGLLGPNGAGKTTTIQMLTGDISPTSGTVTVNGGLMQGTKLNFFNRAHIGRCPQNDPLVDYLTPTEHVQIMSRVRTGLSASEIAKNTEEVLRRIGLEEYANREAAALSGGTRRKLSVALATLPGTQVVFLDEPSTGMDPVARRALWNIIQEEQNKEGHTVVLTTHSMEEAEAVCTNVGIITKGALTCYGSVQHLKSAFSDGYHVAVELSPAASPEACDQAINTLCPLGGGILVDAAGHRRTYNIGRVESLANVFEQLERIKGEAGILSYMVSQTSLEEVFLMLARQNETV